MSRSRGSVHALFLGVASMAAIGCGREYDVEQTIAGKPVRSATVAVAPATEVAETELCEVLNEEPEPPALDEQSERGTITIPTILIAAMPPARAKHNAGAATALNGAIAAAAAKEGDANAKDENATPPKTNGGEVTTTSATVPRGQPAPAFAPARVAFDNRLSSTFQLQRVRVIVDGVLSYDAQAPGSLELAPGERVVEVIADYRLNDPIFTYVRDYQVELRSTEVVPASRVSTAFVVTARPAGDITTPMNRRGALTWRSFPVR
jgi:hypothetical protein